MLSAGVYCKRLSPLWEGVVGLGIKLIGELCDSMRVCICTCACCPQRTLLILFSSVSDILSRFCGSPLVSLVLYVLHLFTPQKRFSNPLPPPPLSLSLYFSLSLYLPYLLLTSHDLSFGIISGGVVRWYACRQPALVSPSAGCRIEFLSETPSQPFFWREEPENILYLNGRFHLCILVFYRIAESETVGP